MHSTDNSMSFGRLILCFSFISGFLLESTKKSVHVAVPELIAYVYLFALLVPIQLLSLRTNYSFYVYLIFFRPSMYMYVPLKHDFLLLVANI